MNALPIRNRLEPAALDFRPLLRTSPCAWHLAYPGLVALLLFMMTANATAETGTPMSSDNAIVEERPDYASTELADIQILEELLPTNLFTIEAILFRRVNSDNALLAQRDSQTQQTGQPTAVTRDSREPLLSSMPRLLPANLYQLSPARITRKEENSNTKLSLRIDPAGEPWCYEDPELSEFADNAEAVDVVEAVDVPLDGPSLAVTQERSEGIFDETALETDDQTDLALEANQFTEQLPFEEALPITDPPMQVFGSVPENRSEVIPTPYLQLISQLSEFAGTQTDNEFRHKPPSEMSMSDYAQRLIRNGGFEILQHMAWQQQVPVRGDPQPIYLNLKDGALQGQIDITLGRYLHTAATLWLRADERVTSPQKEADSQPLVPLYAQMQQSRRMRSGELHYFDHPLFGMIVRIEKVEHPDALHQQFLDFKASLEPSTD